MGPTRLAVFFLVADTPLGVSFQMHAYWKTDDAQMKQIDMINFTKNMALVGALLMFLLLPHPWPMSLGIGYRQGKDPSENELSLVVNAPLGLAWTALLAGTSTFPTNASANTPSSSVGEACGCRRGHIKNL
jgi:hypothetical protein